MGLSVHAPSPRPKLLQWTLIPTCRVWLAALDLAHLLVFPLTRGSRFLMREERRGEIREQKRGGVGAAGITRNRVLPTGAAVLFLSPPCRALSEEPEVADLRWFWLVMAPPL
jgi:hypothetical protein